MLIERRIPDACEAMAQSPASTDPDIRASAGSVPDATPDTDSLRRLVRRIEGADRCDRGVLPVGLDTVDARLPDGGLALAALHEIRPGPLRRIDGSAAGDETGPGRIAAAATDGLTADDLSPAGLAAEGAVLGVTALLLGRAVAGGRGRALWIGARDLPYMPGLIGFGLPADAVLTVTAPGLRDRLWAAEEAAASGAFDAVVLTGDPGGLTASRRLQLAAERGGTLLLALGSRDPASAASAATTRWAVRPIPAPLPVDPLGTPLPGVGDPAWRLELVRARGARPAVWDVVCRPGGVLAPLAEAQGAPLPAGPVSSGPLPDSSASSGARPAAASPVPAATGRVRAA